MKYFSTTILLLIIFSISSNGQGFLKTNGKSIVNETNDNFILRGLGLGGWMIQEGYMMQTSEFANAQYQIRDKIEQLMGVEDTDLYFDTFLKNHIQKIDIDSLKAWGFNSVRLPMHYNLFTLPIEDEPIAGENTWLTRGFDLTDSLISWCSQNQMYVILDLHAAPGGQGKDQGISDYDPLKPSLWESKENRDKTVALWKKLAEKYSINPWIGGYDLINETNWNMSGNNALYDLLVEITDSIRTIDTNHIVFIEGNWFANDFTGLTPPWDDNMVYSPHKYWSTNDQASIQWVLDIRDTYNVPIYLGESGENSNTWFRDAIKLVEEHNIGWAWWPMKKIESISGPLSVIKTIEYQALLDYWNGSGSAPSAAFTKAAMMEIADNYKMENCVFQKDVIDAMFRQVNSDEAVPYRTQSVPGVVFSTDFDMGIVGSAYYDKDVANYHVSTGNYTAWNRGWVYRNDGVDIEISEDNVNSNGYNVGFVSKGEWMQYDVNVASSAVYDIHVRVASDEADGKFHFGSGSADISSISSVPNTSGWQNWQTVVVPDVILTPADKKLRFLIDEAEFNLGSFEFIQKTASTTIETEFLSATTLDDQTVQLNINKPLTSPIPASPAHFQILVNGSPISITDAILNSNSRIITFTLNYTFKSEDVVKISYTGNQITAVDGTILTNFSLKDVQNTVAIIFSVPGKVEAEDYFYQSGIETENTTDDGLGKNIGYLDTGDYLDYYINVSQTGDYTVNYRTAAQSETGQVQLKIIDAGGNSTILQTVNFPSTGGWQTWATTTTQSISLPEGQHHIRVTITKPLFNMNWFEFTQVTAFADALKIEELILFPNPGTGYFTIQGTLKESQDVKIQVYNLNGQPVFSKLLKNIWQLHEVVDLEAFPNGNYYLKIELENGISIGKNIMKVGS